MAQQSNVERLAGNLLWAWGFFGFIVIIMWLAPFFGYDAPRDATDSATARSNMALRIDYGTGCQYLANSSGALTPRIGADGHQICGAAK